VRLKVPVLILFLAAMVSGVNRDDMDLTCKPCTDFWRYVNGGWLDKHPIPAHLSRWGTFPALVEANRERMQTILEAAAADRTSAPGSNTRKMGNLYASCMDTAAIDARGVEPLRPDFERIEKIRSTRDLPAALAAFQQVTTIGFSPTSATVVGPFRVMSRPDAKNSNRTIAQIAERDGAGGGPSGVLSLPDRDYYFKDDAKSKEIREAFVKHVAKMWELVGENQDLAAAHSKVVMAFETSMAEGILNNAERRNPEKTYHMMDAASLNALAPNFDWKVFLREMQLPESTPINVTEPEMLKKFNQQLAAVPIEEWKIWLRWRVLQLSAQYLAKPIAGEEFYFGSTVLSGIKEKQPRAQTCAIAVDRHLSDALGEAFVRKYFPPEAKRRMGQMVEKLRAAMREQLETADWLQPETRKNAIAKLNALTVKIGYADRWRDYSGLNIDRKSYFANIRASWAAEHNYELAKIGKPSNRVDWHMTPPTVNAYSNSTFVEIVFPAGILQPPFFDMNEDDAVNYGAIGSVIGHEMGHQFDDSGSKYDASGNLNNWWTPEDRKKFDERGACVVNEFNTLEVGNGQHHNGKLVLGEALGDLGGVTLAYKAYKRSLIGKPERPVIDGFTGDQRFFIAFARLWGSQSRPEAARLSLNTNPHPLDRFRAIGTLQNIPEFHKAFQCKEGDAMVRPAAERCKLW
jgi:putative endopeptidase